MRVDVIKYEISYGFFTARNVILYLWILLFFNLPGVLEYTRVSFNIFFKTVCVLMAIFFSLIYCVWLHRLLIFHVFENDYSPLWTDKCSISSSITTAINAVWQSNVMYNRCSKRLYLYRVRGLQEVEPPRISRQSAHEGGQVVSPTHRPSLLPREDSWHSFLLEAESTPRPQCGRKDFVNQKSRWPHPESNPQCLNQLLHRVPPNHRIGINVNTFSNTVRNPVQPTQRHQVRQHPTRNRSWRTTTIKRPAITTSGSQIASELLNKQDVQFSITHLLYVLQCPCFCLQSVVNWNTMIFGRAVPRDDQVHPHWLNSWHDSNFGYCHVTIDTCTRV
jgi:hypothetical protein